MKMKLQECGCCWWNGREFGINVSGVAEETGIAFEVVTEVATGYTKQEESDQAVRRDSPTRSSGRETLRGITQVLEAALRHAAGCRPVQAVY